MFKIQTYISAILLLIVTLTVFSSVHAETIPEKAKGLFLCSGFYYILAADTPNIATVDYKALELRNYFADMGRNILEAENNRTITGKEVDSMLSDALEFIETCHKNNKKEAVAYMLSYGIAWGKSTDRFFDIVDFDKLTTASPAQRRQYITEKLKIPSKKQVEEARNNIVQTELEQAIVSLNLWADRGYMNPRKAFKELGD